MQHSADTRSRLARLVFSAMQKIVRHIGKIGSSLLRNLKSFAVAPFGDGIDGGTGTSRKPGRRSPDKAGVRSARVAILPPALNGAAASRRGALAVTTDARSSATLEILAASPFALQTVSPR
jgi:hypothetical protein